VGFLRLKSGLLRGGAVTVLAGLGLAVAASLAGAHGDSYVVGGSSLYPAKAAAQQDYRKDGSYDLKCSSGTYVHAVYETGYPVGLYYAMDGITFQCVAPDGTDATTFFGPNGPPATAGDACSGSKLNPVTGLDVNSDRYIKDIKIRCGTISADGVVTDTGYTGSWNPQNDDTQTPLQCGSGDVVTGLRIGYRNVYDQRAFTSIWLFCAGVGKARSTTSTTTKSTTVKHFVTTIPTVPPKPTRTTTTPKKPKKP
jgi:hypothetical protein